MIVFPAKSTRCIGKSECRRKLPLHWLHNIPIFAYSAFLAIFFQTIDKAHVLAASTERPNIVVILADDLGWGDIGLHGGTARTPNIDRLASEGVELQRYYTYPFCSPTRAALLSGRMPRRFGIINPLGPRDSGLPVGLPTLPRTLQASGYQTSLVGKWHLGRANPPRENGFEHFYGFLNAEIDYFYHTSRNGQVDWQRNAETIYEDGYSTFLLADEAIHLIEERDSDRPFYLQVSFNSPHFPLAAPAEYEAKYPGLSKTAMTRAATIDALDEAIGRVLETLDEQGLRHNTLVLFTSDNGADQTGRNAPFRSGKGSVYEGGIHVPCLIRWPEIISAGSVSKQLINVHDLYPTLAAAAGITLSADQKVDGVNLWSAIQSGVVQDRQPFLIAAANTALFDREWKLIETSDGRMSLFQITDDPEEQTDLLLQQPEVANRLQDLLSAAKKQFPSTEVFNNRPRPRLRDK